MPSCQIISHARGFSSLFFAMLVLALVPVHARASESAYVRVSQVGYEAANAPFQAYLMSTSSESGASFSVINSEGTTV
jgi:hypothetical protein